VSLACRHAFAARIEHAAEAERRQQKRHIERRAQDRRSQIGVRRLDALTWPERHVGEGALVRLQRDLVLSAAVDVVEDDRWKPTLRHTAQIGNVHNL
jgi:hypothetical protein